MADNIDFDATAVIYGSESMDELRDKMCRFRGMDAAVCRVDQDLW
jgi:hypothetical protein